MQAAEMVEDVALNEKFANLLDYLTVPSDKSVKPIIGNPDIEKLEDFEYNAKLQDIELVNLSELSSMDKDELEQYLIEIYKVVVATNSTKERMNMMNYFVSIIQDSNNANLIVESLFMDLFVKLLKTVKSKNFKVAEKLTQVVLCTIIGLCLRHATNVNSDIPKLNIASILLELLKDPSSAVRRRAMAALGEYLFYGSDQIDGTPQNEIWEIPFTVIATLLRIVKSSSEDEIVVLYAIKTVENIVCKSKPDGAGRKFCFPDFVQAALKQFRNCRHQGIRNSAIVALSSICILAPKFTNTVVNSLELKNVFAQVADSEKKSQQALMNLVNLYILYGDETSVREVFDNQKTILPFVVSFLEHGTVAIKCKTLLMFTMMIGEDPSLLNDPVQGKIFQLVEKMAGEKNKHLRNVLKEFIGLLDFQLEKCLEIIDTDFEQLLEANNEEEQDAAAEGQAFETVLDVFSLISVILSSFYVQDCVFGEEKLSLLFRLTRFYDKFNGRDSPVEVSWRHRARHLQHGAADRGAGGLQPLAAGQVPAGVRRGHLAAAGGVPEQQAGRVQLRADKVDQRHRAADRSRRYPRRYQSVHLRPGHEAAAAAGEGAAVAAESDGQRDDKAAGHAAGPGRPLLRAALRAGRAGRHDGVLRE